jgi:DNA-binding beta-propeller fold protein YncE
MRSTNSLPSTSPLSGSPRAFLRLRHGLVAATCWALAALPATAADLNFKPLNRFGGKISREAGSTNYPSGVAVDPNSGDVYVMDLLFNRVQRFNDRGAFIAQWKCKQGLGLTVDPTDGNLWVAMWLNDKVIKYSPTGEVLVEIGSGKKGTGNGEFNRPHDVSVNPKTGDLFVLDTNNKRVQVFDKAGKYKRQFTSDFIQPFGIAVHPEGEFLVVANTANREIMKFSLDGELLDRWKRKGSGEGEFRWPRNVAVDREGNIYVADTDNERAQKLDQDGKFIQFIQGPNDRENGSFHPRAIDVNSTTGAVYAAAAYAHRIDRFGPDGKYVASWGQHDRTTGKFNTPKGVAIHPVSRDVYVSDWMDHRIKRFDNKGEFVSVQDAWIVKNTDAEGTPLTAAYAADPLTGMWVAKEDQAFPGAMDFDAEGNLWMLRGSMHYDDDPRPQADWIVRSFTADGEFIKGWGHESFPRNAKMRGLVVDRKNGHVYVANSANDAIMKFDMDGKLLWQVGIKGKADGQFNFPVGITLDRKRGRIYVLDSRNNRVQVFDLEGGFLRAWGEKGTGPGQFRLTDFSSLVVDPKGYVYVADGLNSRVQAFDLKGNLVGQLGEYGFGGFGKFNGVSALGLDHGKLHVIDGSGGEVEVWKIQYPE